jgi:hypothetical protein
MSGHDEKLGVMPRENNWYAVKRARDAVSRGLGATASGNV